MPIEIRQPCNGAGVRDFASADFRGPRCSYFLRFASLLPVQYKLKHLSTNPDYATLRNP
jgi:hypothetical protein